MGAGHCLAPNIICAAVLQVAYGSLPSCALVDEALCVHGSAAAAAACRYSSRQCTVRILVGVCRCVAGGQGCVSVAGQQLRAAHVSHGASAVLLGIMLGQQGSALQPCYVLCRHATQPVRCLQRTVQLLLATTMTTNCYCYVE